jgi:methylase of polypeptide subunit release factors
MSAASEYAELLKLIEVSGPFLSLPVFKEVFPQGLSKETPAVVSELRELYEEWREARTAAASLVTPAQRDWLRAVFTQLLAWPEEWIAEDNAIPQNLAYTVPQHHETLRPDAVLLDCGAPRLLISVLPPNQEPDRRPPSTTWNASCTTRMAELLRATRIPIGLVTNGERFTIVYAEPGQPAGFADFRAELWFEERLTLRAFRDFLSSDALINRPPDQTLESLFRRSLENQQEVSTTLGRQVRRAVEMFVAALDRADREAGRTLLSGIAEERLYEAALSLMMRLVFLFFAEERDLLPVTNPIYSENYAVSTLHSQLREAADRLGEEVLERRYDAFPRLLAAFRAVHGGVQHDLLPMPAYGGELFDPDRFPFLEGRPEGSSWQNTAAQPLPVHNRTVLHMLEALQFLEMKVPGGGREMRRVSFRALDIEQIGHVYEGLLDHTVRRAPEIVLGLEGKEEPEIPLSELESRRAQPDFVAWLAEQTGRSQKAIERALRETTVEDPLRWPEWDKVKPYAGLVRRDDNGDPLVIPAGSFYVTAGTARRQTGTQYTPRSLTESVVEHALAPLVYEGPAEGAPPEQWRLRHADPILDLKICDLACGSGAFLVAAARYLSARLVEAWEAAQRTHGAHVQITPYGHPSSGLPDEELIPNNPEERALYALRIVVERCLYGVDLNPLAVEMAKLSLWLLTLQRNKPFTFLDHSIRCGDSLLGVNLQQLSTWSLSGEGAQILLFQDDLSFAADKREGLMKMQYHPSDQSRLLAAALEKTRRLRAAADRLIATAFERNPEASAAAIAMATEEQEAKARRILQGRRPFHWPVEFPEVFLYREGFDAIIGNPPFIGGKRISGILGKEYRDYLVEHIGRGVRGHADYVAYFFLRAESLLKPGGTAGLLATNTIAQGDTREVGLDQMTARGVTIFRAIPSRKWPGDASLEVAHVWFRKGSWKGPFVLDDAQVRGITSQLQPPGRVTGKPYRLAANAGLSFIGSYVLGMGFVLTPEEAQRLLEKDPRNRDVLFPYLNGEDLNSRWDQSPSRWVINFHDWPLEEAMEYPDCFEIVERLVKPERTRRKADGSYQLRYPLYERWWHYADKRPELYSTIAGLERVLVVSQTGRRWSVGMVPTGIVYSHSTIIFKMSSYARNPSVRN